MGALSCLSLICQTLLTPHGNPYLLGGVDGVGWVESKGGAGVEVRGKTVVGM